MAQCPVCQANVNADFGLVECEGCGSQLIIHIDGSVEHSGTGTNDELVNVNEDGELSTNSGAELSADEVGAASANEHNEDFAGENEVVAESSDDEFAANSEASESDEVLVGSSDADFLDEDKAAGNDFAETPAFDGSDASDNVDSPAEVYKPPGTTNSPDLSDIAQFGNSEASSGREGALRYSVQITGIDTSNVREDFREAITDRKFMWDVDQIVRSIRNGEVRITNVSATKAYMLISRLRSMPVQVKWEQYAVHQT